MPYLEKMGMHTITEANYVTAVNGMLHPDRIMADHDFLYMLDGTWEIIEEERRYEMKSDDLLILTAGRHHYGDRLCSPGNRHMYIHARPTAAENKMDKTETLFFCPTLLHCQKNPQIRRCFHEIITICWSKQTERDNRLSLLFSLLLCEISALLSHSEPRPAPDELMEEIGRLIRSTPQTFFSAGEIAAQYFICERTLNNRFRKYYGKTFSAFQMETKLEMVRQFLLAQPQAKLHTAAANFGFYDEFHLSRAFKKQFGQAPTQYRQQNGR